MGEMGKNQETVEEFITHTFDPFKNETTTQLHRPTLFEATGVATFSFNVERFQSAGATDDDESFDANRLIIFGGSEKSDHQTTLDRWSALQITEIIFSCDQDNIVCKEEWSNIPEMDEPDFMDNYRAFNMNLVMFESTEQLKKVAFASELEIRVCTQYSNIDLTDEEEENFQDSLKLFYNQVYDDKADNEDINTIKEKYRDQEKRIKEFDKEVAEGGFCFIATAVYEGDDHFNLIVLRSFRDNFLDNYYYGKRFISFYYKYGPRLANMISDNKLLKLMFKPIVNTGVAVIKKFNLG